MRKFYRKKKIMMEKIWGKRSKEKKTAVEKTEEKLYQGEKSRLKRTLWKRSEGKYIIGKKP